jgi:hypothetical protein
MDFRTFLKIGDVCRHPEHDNLPKVKSLCSRGSHPKYAVHNIPGRRRVPKKAGVPNLVREHEPAVNWIQF